MSRRDGFMLTMAVGAYICAVGVVIQVVLDNWAPFLGATAFAAMGRWYWRRA